MGSFDHDGLLTLARKAHAAAGDADIVRLAEDLDTLLHALAHHLDHELPMLSRLPPPEERLLRRGQARLSAAVRALLRDAEGGCTGPQRRCTARLEELVALLTLQSRDERLALHGAGDGDENLRWAELDRRRQPTTGRRRGAPSAGRA